MLIVLRKILLREPGREKWQELSQILEFLGNFYDISIKIFKIKFQIFEK